MNVYKNIYLKLVYDYHLGKVIKISLVNRADPIKQVKMR